MFPTLNTYLLVYIYNKQDRSQIIGGLVSNLGPKERKPTQFRTECVTRGYLCVTLFTKSPRLLYFLLEITIIPKILDVYNYFLWDSKKRTFQNFLRLFFKRMPIFSKSRKFISNKVT